MSYESPIARSLRTLQIYDEVTPWTPHRYLIIRAQTLLGGLLGLECTGVPDGYEADGEVAYWSHNGDTCPVHEWLVPSDHPQYSEFELE